MENFTWTFDHTMAIFIGSFALLGGLRRVFGPRQKVVMALTTFGLFMVLIAFLILIAREKHMRWVDLMLILAMFGSVAFITMSQFLMWGGASWLTKWRGEKWVKEIDYVYLAFGAVGMAISSNRLAFVTDNLVIADTYGPMLLIAAIVVRAIKTRAEIAGWNKVTI
jgi:multisubunit Na+/H+ antiporter MnhF subunit